MRPLRITACSVASACGAGVAGAVRGPARGAQRTARQRFHGSAARDLHRPGAGGRGLRTAGGPRGVGVPQQPPRLAGARLRRLPRAGARGARALRRRARGAGARNLHLQHRRDRGGLSTTAAGRPLPGGPASPDRAHAALAGRLRARRPRARRRRGHGRHGLLLERQGVRPGRAAAEARASPTPRSSAAWTRCAAACCSASIRSSSSRRSPAARSTSRDAASASARPAALPCWSASGERGPWLLGYGESSDAHHMSSPHPQGLGARLAIEAALASAGLAPEAVDYINLHGTASQRNDEVEARVIAELFPATTRASSTKGWTGHTLGAAGIVEAVIAFIALEEGIAPGTLNTRDARSGLRPAGSPRHGAGGRAGRAQQLVRLRRQQLRAAVRPRAQRLRPT